MKKFYDEITNQELLNTLLEQIRDLWTHNTTAIEGNSLTLGDTHFILTHGLTVSGKSIKEHLDVIGHAEAISLVYELVNSDINIISKGEICKLHKLIFTEKIKDIYKPIGNWKNESNYTSYLNKEGKFKTREYPRPEFTDKLMKQFIFELHSAKPTDNSEAMQCYADIHLKFVTIHPFFDGNGRLARLLANIPLLRNGFSPVVIPVSDRKNYIQAISSYQESILNLEKVDDLIKLDTEETISLRNDFSELCYSYQSEVIDLIENAINMQNYQNGSESRM